jgi:hypothetical protein
MGSFGKNISSTLFLFIGVAPSRAEGGVAAILDWCQGLCFIVTKGVAT